MRENCTSGSVAGAPGNRSPYAGGILFSSSVRFQGFTRKPWSVPYYLSPITHPILSSLTSLVSQFNLSNDQPKRGACSLIRRMFGHSSFRENNSWLAPNIYLRLFPFVLLKFKHHKTRFSIGIYSLN